MTKEPAKVVRSHSIAIISAEEEPVGVLSSLASMKKHLTEFFLLHPRERGVDGGQKQVHEEVEDDRDVADEEDGGPARHGVRGHHHIRIAKKTVKIF